LAHAKIAGFEGGFVGVDVFFILSGYLITGFLVRELHETGRIRLFRFYARRLKRLLPALAAMLVAATGAALWLLSDLEGARQLASGPFAASWTSNLFFAFDTVGYFDELAARDLFLHTWSLGVEEQFYLVWPLLLLALFFVIGMRKFAGGNRAAWGIGLGIIFLISLAGALVLGSISPSSAFYLMPARIWQFALGALVFIALSDRAAAEPGISENSSRLYRHGAWLALAVGLALILGSAHWLHENLAYPGLWALAPSLGAALVIAAGHGIGRGSRGPLAHPALVWVGDRSYSLYLWHWPILTLGFSLGLGEQANATAALIVLSVLAAALSYQLVEIPFWKGRLSRATTARALLASALVIGVLVAAFAPILKGLEQRLDTLDTSENPFRITFPALYMGACDDWFEHAEVKPCVSGNAEAAKTVMLVGDSIGVQWFSMVSTLFPAPEWRTVVLTKSGCAIVDEDYFYDRIGKIYEVCTDWRNAVLLEIERDPPDVLVMGNSYEYDFTETQWTEGTARILERLNRVVDATFLIPGTPNLGFNGPGCVTRREPADAIIDRNQCSSTRGPAEAAIVASYLANAVERFPNVHLLDLNDIVCPGAVCKAVSADGLLVFRDSHHLNDVFVKARIDVIRERLERIVPGLTTDVGASD
ncbi:MAG: acyltransferase family protein, partial [Xanthomonadales bacterium]|nr:acyltransferase family protein [Xanthomonadales bacterium]